MEWISLLLPSADRLGGLLAVLAVAAILAAIGGLAGGSRRAPEFDVFAGWGVVSALFVVAGGPGGLPFTWLTYAVLAGAVGFAAARWRANRDPAGFKTLWRPLLLALPLLLLVTAMAASQWDEFAHWLPNGQYIVRHDSFPRTGLPANPSAWPAYPYALPIVTYLASRLAGLFVENAGAVFNVLLLVLYVPTFLGVVGRGLGAAADWRRTWGAAALGFLGVTVFSTTFVQKVVLTGYGETATAVVLAAAAVAMWRLLEADDRQRARARALAWQGGLCLVVLVSLKQANIVLAGLLVAGFCVAAARDPRLGLGRFARHLPALLVPGALTWLAWRFHVSVHIPGGEPVLGGPETWAVDQAFTILVRMSIIAAKKAPYFLMMAVIVAYAGRGLWRFRGSFHRLAIPVAVTFVGYNAFLWGIYATALADDGGLAAVSYWRFNTQLGILGCTCAAYGLAKLWKRHLAAPPAVVRLLGALGVLAVLVLPAAFSEKLRFDVRPDKTHIRLAGQEMAGMLPQGARLTVYDPHGNGLAATIVRYELTSGPGAGRELFFPGSIGPESRDRDAPWIRARLDALSPSHVWVRRPDDGARAVFGVPLAPGASHLVARRDGAWRVVHTWPDE